MSAFFNLLIHESRYRAEAGEPLYFSSGDEVVSESQTLGTWVSNGDGGIAQDTTAYIRFSPGSKRECWTGGYEYNPSGGGEGGTGGPLVIGETYRVEIAIGTNSAGTLTALTKTNTNANQGVGTLSANTSGPDNAFEFVAQATFIQQNIQTSLGSGYVQCGRLDIWGPL